MIPNMPDGHKAEEFWEYIKHKASGNMGRALKDNGPADEDEVKCQIVHALRHADWKTNAEVFVESVEWMVAYLMLKYLHESPTGHYGTHSADKPR